MKTIVLFSRCDLVNYYSNLSKLLSNDFQIIHLAYSHEEEEILKNNHAKGTLYNFLNGVKEIYKNEVLNPALIKEIDELIIDQTEGRFCLNSAIQSDRTFQYLSYHDSLIVCQTYYKFWKNFLGSTKLDVLLHEPTSLFFNHIAAVLCKCYNVKYLSQIQVPGLNKFNWLLVEADNGNPIEFEFTNEKSSAISTKEFIEKYTKNSKILLSEYNKKILIKSDGSFISLIQNTLSILYKYFKNSLRTVKRAKYDPIDHLAYFLHKKKISNSKELLNLWMTYFKLTFDEFDKSSKYFYYPIHLEPEAVVLYWGDGIYKNQVKLIENIASQLPAGYYLYVKDHPHAGLYRDFNDYKTIKAVPNIKLLNPDESSKDIIKHSQGVITISGTAGFEGLLFYKNVITFGKAYYQFGPFVNYIQNIKDLRPLLYHLKDKNIFHEELESYLKIYLKNVHNGFVNYFSKRDVLLKIDNEENNVIVAKELANALTQILK